MKIIDTKMETYLLEQAKAILTVEPFRLTRAGKVVPRFVQFIFKRRHPNKYKGSDTYTVRVYPGDIYTIGGELMRNAERVDSFHEALECMDTVHAEYIGKSEF